MDFSGNPYAEKSFDFYDFELLKVVNHGDQNAHAFFRLLALCHTVMPEVHEDGELNYPFITFSVIIHHIVPYCFPYYV